MPKEEKRTVEEILDYAADDFYADCQYRDVKGDIPKQTLDFAALKQAVFGNIDGAIWLIKDPDPKAPEPNCPELIEGVLKMLEEGLEIFQAYIDRYEGKL